MLPEGYPVIDVSPDDVLARGTADPLADAARLAEIVPSAAKGAPSEVWPEVPGELMTFDDPAIRLPSLDHLEGFSPGGPSLYERVALIVRCVSGDPVPAWVYVRGGS